MMTFSSYLSNEHHRCDGLFSDTEAMVEKEDWNSAEEAHRCFREAMENHFLMEEEVLFPAVEAMSGSSDGPTAVMRQEHKQMRHLFNEMSQAIEAEQAEDYLGASETLLVLMQQHNAKEEQILYPSSERLLAEQQDALLAMMKDIATSS